MDDLNVLNIPAFQRKRSIAAHARKNSSYLPPMNPPLKPARKTRTRTQIRTRRKTKAELFMTDIPINKPTFEQPLIFGEEVNPFEQARQETATDSTLREMRICGKCEGFFDKIDVAVLKLTCSLRKGDRILFETSEGLFEQGVSSMQIDREDVSIAYVGDDIGLKVELHPKVGGLVYKVI